VNYSKNSKINWKKSNLFIWLYLYLINMIKHLLFIVGLYKSFKII
jgi:hypothetical protein